MLTLFLSFLKIVQIFSVWPAAARAGTGWINVHPSSRSPAGSDGKQHPEVYHDVCPQRPRDEQLVADVELMVEYDTTACISSRITNKPHQADEKALYGCCSCSQTFSQAALRIGRYKNNSHARVFMTVFNHIWAINEAPAIVG